MALIVLKILGLLSRIHLHCLEFRRQGFFVKFHCVLLLSLVDHVVDQSFAALMTCIFYRVVLGSYFNDCKDRWRRIPLSLTLRILLRLGRSTTTVGIRFGSQICLREVTCCSDLGINLKLPHFKQFSNFFIFLFYFLGLTEL